MEGVGGYERSASQPPGRSFRARPGWIDPPLHGILPTGVEPEDHRRSISRGIESMLFARPSLEGPGGPGRGHGFPEAKGFGAGGHWPELDNHTEVGACANGTRPIGQPSGDERGYKGATSRVEGPRIQVGFLWKVRQRREQERRGRSERQREEQRKSKGQREAGGREVREEVKGIPMSAMSSEVQTREERLEEESKGDRISSVAESDSSGARAVGEVALRDAAVSFSPVQQPSIGAVVDCVRHQTALSEKMLESFSGRRFGEAIPWLVLGLSYEHFELCKTVTPGEILPFPLDTPWKLAEVQGSSYEVQLILLGLIVGLNSLNGQGIRWEGELSQAQKKVLLNLLNEAKRFEKIQNEMRFEDCDWKGFLKVRSIDYKGEEVRVAQYTSWGNLAPALPQEIGTVKLEDVMERGAKHYALNFDSFLVPADAQEYTKPPRVMVEDKHWAEVCKGLLDKGVCGLLSASEVYQVKGKPLLNGMFGVSKNETVNIASS